MKKYVKIALLVIVALIFIGTFVFLYQKSQPKASVYTILNAEITDLKKTTVATGKIEPRDEILIKPQISGIIDEVYKEAGQKIKKGEVIAKVKVIPELGQLNSAESRVRLAEINARQGETDFARMKKLFESKLISSEEYEKSEVAVKQAREELQTAKDNLEIVKEGITKNKASFSSTLIRSISSPPPRNTPRPTASTRPPSARPLRSSSTRGSSKSGAASACSSPKAHSTHSLPTGSPPTWRRP